MNEQAKSVDVSTFVDGRRISPYQYKVVLLCGLLMLIDGFDTQAISYMAPDIAKEWGLSRPMLGRVFSSALAGLMVGYLFISPLSDRFGHKRLIILSTLSFGVFTLLGLWATTVEQLMALRFVTGMGLGAVATSAIALTGEYSPKRFRASFVLFIYCGFSLGFIVAGMVAAWLLPLYGWRSMFWAGALAPFLLIPALILFLPESLSFLMKREGEGRGKVMALLRRMDPQTPRDAQLVAPAPEPQARLPMSGLFRNGRALGTVLLWAIFALNLGEFYALQSWLPSILTGLDYPMSVVVSATTLTTVGGIAIAFIVGPSMDRLGAYGTLSVLYLVGCVFLAMVGAALNAPLWVLLLANFLAGCCVSGGQKCVIALAAIFYPPAIRSTGVGWALGIGRIGGIGGPLVVGALLGFGWAPQSVFYAMAVPMLVMAAMILLMRGRYATAAPEGAADAGEGLPSATGRLQEDR